MFSSICLFAAEISYIYYIYTLQPNYCTTSPMHGTSTMHDDYSFLEIMFISNVLVSNAKNIRLRIDFLFCRFPVTPPLQL